MSRLTLLITVLILLLSCNEETYVYDLADDLTPAFKTGSAELLEDQVAKEAYAGIFCTGEDFENCLATAIMQYYEHPLYTYGFTIYNINTSNIGDTIAVTEKCISRPCPSDTIAQADLVLNGGDQFPGIYQADINKTNWLVIEAWDPAERRLQLSFDIHLRRTVVISGWQDLIPSEIHYSEGYVDATVYLE